MNIKSDIVVLLMQLNIYYANNRKKCSKANSGGATI